MRARAALLRHLIARYPGLLALLGVLLIGLGALGLAALRVAQVPGRVPYPPPASEVVESDPLGSLRVLRLDDGRLDFADVSGVAFSLPEDARVRQVKRPDPSAGTAVRVQFAWGSDCADDHCVQPGGFLQFGTVEGVTGRWYHDEVRRFESYEQYVRYAYYSPVRRMAGWFRQVELEATSLAGAPAWTMRYWEPQRDQPRRSWDYFQVTDNHYLNVSFVAPPEEVPRMEEAIRRVLDSIRAP